MGASRCFLPDRLCGGCCTLFSLWWCARWPAVAVGRALRKSVGVDLNLTRSHGACGSRRGIRVGDIHSATVEEIWTGERVQRLRAEMFRGVLSRNVCRTCRGLTRGSE